MRRLIVTDAGPLIIYARTKKLDVLLGTADQVIVTEAVKAECVSKTSKPGAKEILSALEDGRLHLVSNVFSNTVTNARLDLGEASAISYALTLGPAYARLLIDEKRGRAVAQKLGLTVIGSAGLLAAAKHLGIIDNVKQVIDEWQETGYWIDPRIVDKVLRNAGEIPLLGGQRKP
jgi:predicted nucleic acid-binding protein